VGPKIALDAVEYRKFSLTGIEPGTSSPQLYRLQVLAEIRTRDLTYEGIAEPQFGIKPRTRGRSVPETPGGIQTLHIQDSVSSPLLEK
jgi:hypothetical protein